MYCQRRPTHHCLRTYQQQLAEGRNSTPPEYAECVSEWNYAAPAVGSMHSGDFSTMNCVVGTSRQPEMDDVGGLRRVWDDGHAETPAWESRVLTSSPRDVTRQGDERPRGVLPAPGPYDCKPPYSYISLIAMAIESSPGRRLILVCILRAQWVKWKRRGPGPPPKYFGLEPPLGAARAGFKCVEALGRIIIRGPYPPSNAIIYMHLQL